jgi:hypothetical protein
MPWVSLGSFYLTQEWQFTLSVEGEIFRIKHLPITNTDVYLKGVIASVFVDEYKELNVFEPKRLTYREEKEIFTFYSPTQVNAVNLIGFKRLDRNNNIDWIIEAEVYQADNQAEDFDNYLLTRFGDIMAYLVNRFNGSSSVTPITFNGNMKAATVESLVAANSNRTHLIIRAGDKAINLYASKSQAGSGENLIETVAAQQIFILPNQGGIYKGEVFCKSVGADSTVSVTEYA